LRLANFRKYTFGAMIDVDDESWHLVGIPGFRWGTIGFWLMKAKTTEASQVFVTEQEMGWLERGEEHSLELNPGDQTCFMLHGNHVDPD